MDSTVLPQLGESGRILEGIVTTFNADGTVNIAPMGPLVDESFDTLVLRPFRPFRTSNTCENILRTREGVLHVTDDVELFARAAMGVEITAKFSQESPLVLADACRWYAFKVESVDESAERVALLGRTTDRGVQREFFGFNRAKHAVIEAAILATRVSFLPAGEIMADFARLRILVDKTGAAAEHRAFNLLEQYVRDCITRGAGNP
jgi:uncharacterized protein